MTSVSWSSLTSQSEIGNRQSAMSSGPVAQWNQSATLRRSRSHVQVVPGPPKETDGEKGGREKSDIYSPCLPVSHRLPHPRILAGVAQWHEALVLETS